MNYTEMEGKVREATNNEPWGTSSSLMQEIANGTYSYQTRNEILGMIFRRFQEKTAPEWRQVYKALQLLEYLLKHGAERVVDDAKINSNLVSMLRSFRFVDQNGKDQGINVRNRAKEVLSLLEDDDRLRSERKKARDNAKKYGGMASDGSIGISGRSSFHSSSNSQTIPRFAIGSNYDYDSDAYDPPSNAGVYGDGGVFGQQTNVPSYSVGSSSRSRQEYEEYNVESEPKKSAPTSVTKKPDVDLFSFDDSTNNNNSKTSIQDDDEFDDFQTAVGPAVTSPAAPVTKNDLADLFSSTTSPAQFNTTTSSNINAFGGFTSFTSSPSTQQTQSAYSTPVQAPHPRAPSYSISSVSSTPAVSTTKKDDAFSSLFSNAVSTSKTVHKPRNTSRTDSLASLSKQKQTESLWGPPTPTTTNSTNNSSIGKKDDFDLLF